MTAAPLHNALLLGAAALVFAIALGRFLAKRGGRDGGIPPFMAEQGAPEHTAGEDGAEILERRYALKNRFRLGVLFFSLAALAAYGWGGSRPGALFLMLCAGLCQYGVYRQRTAALLARALRREMTAAPARERPEGGKPVDAAPDAGYTKQLGKY